jgi:hypothetical protein
MVVGRCSLGLSNNAVGVGALTSTIVVGSSDDAQPTSFMVAERVRLERGVVATNWRTMVQSVEGLGGALTLNDGHRRSVDPFKVVAVMRSWRVRRAPK